MRIYISGPITGTDDAQERFEAMAKRVEEYGHTPINPCYLNRAMPNGAHSEYMALSFALMMYADGVLFMTGWDKSIGARMEHSRARAARMPVYYSPEELRG